MIVAFPVTPVASVPSLVTDHAECPLPLSYQRPVFRVEIAGVSNFNPRQVVFVNDDQDRARVMVAQFALDGITVARHVEIDQWGVRVIDVEDTLSPIHRADAVIAMRAADVAITGQWLDGGCKVTREAATLERAVRVMDRCEVGVRRA